MQRLHEFIQIEGSRRPSTDPVISKRLIHGNPESVFTWLMVIISALLLANLILQGIAFSFHELHFKGMNRILNMFNVDMEQNIPSIFSFTLLLVASMLLGVLAMSEIPGKSTRTKQSWWVLAVVFYYLAIDELIEIHEFMAIFLRNRYHLSGIFWYAWVIPFGLGLAFMAVFFYRFVFFDIPSRTRKLFLLSAATYVFGALIVEMAGGWYFTHYGSNNYTWIILTSIEEGLEMAGTACFIYALMDYIRNHTGPITARLDD